jgi:hypothetical protein
MAKMKCQHYLAYAAKLTLIATLCGLWLFAGMGQSYACSCVPPGSPSEALAKSTVVFAGKVVSIRGFEVPASGIVSTADLGTIELRVSTVWKGPVQETMFVTTVRDGAGCGFTFTEGQEYVVYSRSDATPPEVSLCSRTRLASNAQEDFAALGEGRTPEPGSRAPEPTATPTLTPTPEPTATPTPQPAVGGCNSLAQSAHAPMDTWALGLIAGVALLALRRHPRR